MAVKTCYVCDEVIVKGEPRIVISGLTVHEYCAPDGGMVCQTSGCMWEWTVHSGECV